jgi:hypothetical protein
MRGDDLSILLFWITLAVTFGYEAVKAETILRRVILGALAGVFLLSGLFWLQIKKIWPPLTESMASIATSPQSWFVLFIFISAILVFGRPKRPPRASDNEPSHEDACRDENSEIAAQLARQLSELQGQLDSISTVHNATTIAAVDLTKEVREKLDKLEKNTANSATVSNPQTERDLLMLMHFIVYQSTVLMLDDLLNSAPEGMDNEPLQLGGDFVLKNVLAKEFVELVRRKLDPGSYRRSNFESVMHNAEVTAERRLEETPVEQRPNGIDTLALRRWVIAQMQCVCAIEFLQEQKNEAARNILNQRSNLLERYRLRNPQ